MKRIHYQTCGKLYAFIRLSDGSLMPFELWQELTRKSEETRAQTQRVRVPENRDVISNNR